MILGRTLGVWWGWADRWRFLVFIWTLLIGYFLYRKSFFKLEKMLQIAARICFGKILFYFWTTIGIKYWIIKSDVTAILVQKHDVEKDSKQNKYLIISICTVLFSYYLDKQYAAKIFFSNSTVCDCWSVLIVYGNNVDSRSGEKKLLYVFLKNFDF